MSKHASRWQVPGPHRVLAVEIGAWAEVDDGRLAVFAQLPASAGAGALPVVVLSHGLGGDHHGYAALGAHLASHGYAVLHPQFLDSRSHLIATREIARVLDSRPRGDEAVAAAIRPMLFDPAHWRSRARRVHAVLDSLAGQQHLPVCLGDTGVVVLGHSYGAYTAQLVLGVQLFGVGSDVNGFHHPSIGCGVLVSPQGSGDRGLTEHSWDGVTAPILVITAERDLGPHGEGVAWRREPYDRAASPSKHLAIIRDTDHHMGGIAMTDEDLDRAAADQDDAWARAVVAALSLAFIESARGNVEAGSWLAGGPMPPAVDHEQVGWAA